MAKTLNLKNSILFSHHEPLFLINLNKNRMKKLYNLIAIIALPAILILYSYSSGSPGGKTGSMGDGGNTCTDCHNGTAISQGGWITTDIPMEGFTPGETYTIVATGTHTGVVKFGFELTAEDMLGNKTGLLTITEATRTKLANANKSVTHTSAGNTPTGNMNTWTMNWTAPDPAPSSVNFNAAYNAANGNGMTSGDVIYKSEISVQLYTPMPQITSVDPDHAQQGFEGEITISGENTDWTAGVDEVLFVYHDNNTVMFEGKDIVVSSDELLTVNVSIPIDIEIGSYDVYVNNVMLMNGFVVDILDDITDRQLEQSVSVFPNPAINSITISAPTGSEITIIDISGRMINRTNILNKSIDIDVSSYKAGLYFVQTTFGGNSHSQKLIVR